MKRKAFVMVFWYMCMCMMSFVVQTLKKKKKRKKKNFMLESKCPWHHMNRHSKKKTKQRTDSKRKTVVNQLNDAFFKRHSERVYAICRK